MFLYITVTIPITAIIIITMITIYEAGGQTESKKKGVEKEEA
jgi:hypothetical protein